MDDLFEPKPEPPSVNTPIPGVSTQRIHQRATIRLGLSSACGIWNESQRTGWPYPSAYVRQVMPHKYVRGWRGDFEFGYDAPNPFVGAFREDEALNVAPLIDLTTWQCVKMKQDEDKNGGTQAFAAGEKCTTDDGRESRLRGTESWKKMTKIEEIEDSDDDTEIEDGTDERSSLQTVADEESSVPDSSDWGWDILKSTETDVTSPTASVSPRQLEIRPRPSLESTPGVNRQDFLQGPPTLSLLADCPSYTWYCQEVLGPQDFNAAQYPELFPEVSSHDLGQLGEGHILHLSKLHAQINDQLSHIRQLQKVAFAGLDHGVVYPAIRQIADLEAFDYNMRLENEAQRLEERLEDIELTLSRSGEVGQMNVENLVLHRLAISRDEVELHIDRVEGKWRSWPLTAEHPAPATLGTKRSHTNSEVSLNLQSFNIHAIFEAVRSELQKYSWDWHQISVASFPGEYKIQSSLPLPVLSSHLTTSFTLPLLLTPADESQYQTHIFFCLAFGFIPLLPQPHDPDGVFDFRFYQGEGPSLVARLEGLEKQLACEMVRWDEVSLESLSEEFSGCEKARGVRLAVEGLNFLVRKEWQSLGLVVEGEDNAASEFMECKYSSFGVRSKEKSKVIGG